LPRILDCVLDDSREFIVYGDDYETTDGSCVRDYVHVLDIAQAHILAMDGLQDEQRQGAFNIGSSRGYSVREVVRTVEEVTGRNLRIRVGARRQGDPAILVATHDRVVRELGWKPRFSSLQQIVKSAWDWRQKHPQGYTTVPEVTAGLTG
jgi:UDP-glucose 4-epimerase